MSNSMKPCRWADLTLWLLILAALCLALERVGTGEELERVELPNGYSYACDRRGPVRTIIGNIRDRRQERRGPQVAPATPMPQPSGGGQVLEIQGQVRIPPAVKPTPATPAGGSIYANPYAGRLKDLQEQVGDLEEQLQQAQVGLADCAQARAEWKERADSLAKTAAQEHKARLEIAEQLAATQQRLSQCDACGVQATEAEAEDPFWWRLVQPAATWLGISTPWAAGLWLMYRGLHRWRRKRRTSEASADGPFE